MPELRIHRLMGTTCMMLLRSVIVSTGTAATFSMG